MGLDALIPLDKHPERRFKVLSRGSLFKMFSRHFQMLFPSSVETMLVLIVFDNRRRQILGEDPWGNLMSANMSCC